VSGSLRCSRLHSAVLPAAFHQSSASFRCQRPLAAPVRILKFMNTNARGLTAALAVTLPVHLLLILSGGVAALVLLVYIGIVLPAVWSAKPARRKAAAAVLCQVLNAWIGRNRR
jgi:hypothetical protein